MAVSFSLADKVAIVTGGRQGIGRTVALALAEAGADVVVSDLVVEDGKLEEVSGEIQKLGRRSLAVQADTRRRSDVDHLVKATVDQFGAVDILINNAGILIRQSLLDIDENDWDRLFNVDLKGYFLCCQSVGRRMIEQKRGNIINMTSQFAFKVEEGMGAYAIAKSGVVMLTRAFAKELAKYGVRVNAIAPSMVKTEFSRPSWSDPDRLRQYERSVPLGRVAETTDLEGATLFLASGASGYVTGHTIVVDGGILA